MGGLDVEMLRHYIHSDRNRSERLWGGGGRSTAPGAYTSVCEEREHRPTPPRSRAVDLCRNVYNDATSPLQDRPCTRVTLALPKNRFPSHLILAISTCADAI